MKKIASILALGAGCIILATGMTACDETYDLTKDIDKTIGIGGDHLTIPASSTQYYTMQRILNLNEDSPIKADEKGDYCLIQKGEETNSKFDIKEVEFDHNIESSNNVTANFPTIPGDPSSISGGVSLQVGAGSTSGFNVHTNALVNNADIKSDDVPDGVKKIIAADIDMQFTVELVFTGSNYRGDYTIDKGFRIAFDKSLDLTVSDSFLEVQKGVTSNDVVFTSQKKVDAGKTLKFTVRFTHIDVPENAQTIKNGKFKYTSGITSTGKIILNVNGLKGGTAPSVNVAVNTKVAKGAKVTEVTGIVDPVIDVEDSRFNINDVPDFLSDNKTELNLIDPRIYFTVDNSSPCKVNINATLTSYKDGKAIGKAELKTFVDAGTNNICFVNSNKSGLEFDSNNNSGCRYVEVPGLSELIRKIPDYVELKVQSVKVEQVPVRFKLGHAYNLRIDNEVRIPLIFGEGTYITYTDSETGWDEEDLSKFNFNTVIISGTAENTIPITFHPEVTPIFRDGRAHNVEVNLENCVIAPGTLQNPSKTEVKIIITAKPGDNLGSLDGIEYTFIGEKPVENTSLNEKQGLRFENVRITVQGGLTYDLN